jgi:hypothetical protein
MRKVFLLGFEAAAGWIAATGAAAMIAAYLRSGRRERALIAIILLALAVSAGRHVEITFLWLHLSIG